jgi:23S rRNA pseudouridine1911/1915/1917 synthase
MIQPEHLPTDIDVDLVESDQAPLEFDLDLALSGQRLDKALATLLPEHSRGRIQGWIEAGHVMINGAVQTRVRQLVSGHDHVTVQVQPTQQSMAFEPQNIEFEVVHETDQWLVVDKHAGLVVHPGAGNWQNTLLNGLLFRYPALAAVARAGIVHRLDKDTSGLMVVAKTETAQTHLVRQLQQRSVKRQYRALAHAWLDVAKQSIDRSIGRDPRVPVRMSVMASGPSKPALTHVTRLRTGKFADIPVSEVQCQLETGRTHQIRVHLASVKHPLVGDVLYGGRQVAQAQRHMLHAEHLCFLDPVSEQPIAFDSPMPADMQAVWDDVRWTTTQGRR